MANKLLGKDGERLATDLLLRQKLINGNKQLAEGVFHASRLQEFQVKETIVEEGSEETDIYFILTGNVEVEVNGRKVANRQAGQHIGEMALINSALPRSATVRAAEKTTCAIVTEADFTSLATTFPDLWRLLAIELSEKLRERGKFLSPPNETPEIFIGCSREMLVVAQQIQLALNGQPMLVTIWTDSFFRASKTTIESLLDGFNKFDFAILVLGKEDLVTSRSKTKPAPRDNVVFELGLAMGALSRERTFMVYEQGLDTKIPSDLLGVTPMTYRDGTPNTLATRIAPVATQIRLEVEEKGPK
jgi:predicted nucleotide-binding protein